MNEFNLIKIDGKPLEKLVEIISNGVGRLYEPTEIRKRADAKAYEIGIIERSKAIANAESKEIEQDYLDRIERRIIHRELKRQKNLDHINYIAAENLKDENTVSDEPVSEDWTTRFFNIAEDISNEEMQILWGRILAGEVKRPGSYSLRTLELLKNLSKKDAECFIKFGHLAITSNQASFVINFRNESLLEEKYKLNYSDRLLLEELDLLSSNVLSYTIYESKDSDTQAKFRIGDTIIVVNKKKDSPKQTLNVLVFTEIGKQLLKLLKFSPETDYLQLFASKLRREGVTVKYAKILNNDNDGYQYRHTSLIDVPLTDEEKATQKKNNAD